MMGVLTMIRNKQFSISATKVANYLITLSAGLCLTGSLVAQDTVEWTTLGNDFAHTRSTQATQITPQNFGDLVEKKILKEKLDLFNSKIKKKYKIISVFKKDDIQTIKKVLVTNVNR